MTNELFIFDLDSFFHYIIISVDIIYKPISEIGIYPYFSFVSPAATIHFVQKRTLATLYPRIVVRDVQLTPTFPIIPCAVR